MYPCDRSNKSYCLSVTLVLAVDIIDGHGLSNKVRVGAKKSRVMLYLPFISQYKA